MFTGYIDHCGKILKIENTAYGKRFLVGCHFQDLTKGESIAVNGTCLTVTDCTPEQFYCDLSPETLSVTTAKDLKTGSPINLERSLRANDRLHGHFVMGHIDQVCTVTAKKSFDEYTEYHFKGVLKEMQPFLATKGCIAINGISLTLNTINKDTFAVMLIPETLRKTNLAILEVGDNVNVEYDYLAKIVHSRNSLDPPQIGINSQI